MERKWNINENGIEIEIEQKWDRNCNRNERGIETKMA